MVEQQLSNSADVPGTFSMLECRETLATPHILFHLLFYNGDEDRWSNQRCLLVPLRPSPTVEEQTRGVEAPGGVADISNGTVFSASVRIWHGDVKLNRITKRKKKHSWIFPESQLLSQRHETWRTHWHTLDWTAAQTVQTQAVAVSALTLR